MSIIEVKNIGKTFKVAKRNSGMKNAAKAMFKREYEYINALNDVSFNIDKGEIVGYIGPNGAGKSTTIKILCGILVPDSGECIINGRTPWKERKRHVADIGVVFGQRSQLWWDIPVEDSFDLLRDIYNIDETEYKKTKDCLIQILSLDEIIKTPVRQLSLGQRMRCEIAASLLHNPKILFLDEPTIGLDAVSKIAVRDFIKYVNKEKDVTVILTTHDMPDIEALATRIMLIGKGSILYSGALETIKNKYITNKIMKISYGGSLSLPDIHGVTVIEKDNEKILLDINTRKIPISSVLSAYSENLTINDVSIIEESIDDVIVKLYKEHQI